MGIGKPIEEYEQRIIRSLGLKTRGLKWCELGQKTSDDESASHAHESLGIQHISLDINGKDGALAIDLDKPVPFILLDRFDVLTNYGTIEHVNNQYQVFKNIHDMCNQNGIMIHIFPLQGHWPEHCRYYYSENFAKGLANACGYRLVSPAILDKGDYTAPKNLLAATYQKEKNDQFISQEEFCRVDGLLDTGDVRFTGNYTKREDALDKIKRIGKRLLGKL